MKYWEILWKFVFLSSVTLFAGMSVWVTVQGWRDIRRMLSNIERQHDEGEG